MGLWLVAESWGTSALAAVPAVSVSYSVVVHGSLAETVVDQEFVTSGDEPEDLVYVFPLHPDAAVDAMQMQVGDRVVEGRILELEQARVLYSDAVAAGHTAALTTQHRPDLFTQEVGNVPPGVKVHVRMRVVQPVPHVQGAYDLVLPLVVAPRFVSAEEWADPNFDRVLAGPLEGVDAEPVDASIDVIVDSPLPFRSFDCPSHDLGIAQIDDSARGVTGEVPMDRDFVLRWTVDGDEPLAGLVVQSGHALLTLEPPEAAPLERTLPRELWFVVDQSCSMTGGRLALAKEAILEALNRLHPTDSVGLLQFSDRVEGDRRSRPATPEVLDELRERVRKLSTGGGTYLLDGVLAALRTPRDPGGRARTVVFLTDGEVSNDQAVLQAIADEVGAAHLFAFGVGEAPNRALLDRMAAIGGGTTSWLVPGEEPRDAVDAFADTLARPLLDDLRVDWGDWEVEDPYPSRLPALYVGQPMALLARVVREGTTPVVVRGRMGDAPFEAVVEPEHVEDGRAVPSTWARRKIAQLEEDQIFGPDPELSDELLRTSLAYQVLSSRTAFVAVAPSEPAKDRVRPPDQVLPDDQEDDEDGDEEILVEAHAPAVDTNGTTFEQVLTKDFLRVVPIGRSYQQAVTLASGVTSGVSNPVGGAYVERTCLVDGANATDPVTGTFSMNFDYDAIQEVEVLLGGYLPEFGGVSPIVNVVTRSATNNLESSVEVGHRGRISDEDAALDGDFASASLSGPVVRDHLWVIGSYGYDGSTLADPARPDVDRDFVGHTASARLTAQPTTDHRLAVDVGGHTSRVVEPDGAVEDGSGRGAVTWQWFQSMNVNTEARVSSTWLAVDGDRRQAQLASVELNATAVTDPLGGKHDLKLGAEADRAAWTFDSDWASAWLGVPVPPADQRVYGDVFAQDSWRPVPRLTLLGGARLDVALGRAFPGPRVYAVWDPWGDQKTKLVVGYGRRYGLLTLPEVAIEPEQGLTGVDEVMATAEREIVQDLAVGSDGAFRRTWGVPIQGGGRVDRTTWSLTARLRKVESRRWFAELAWTWTQALDEPDGTLLVGELGPELFAEHGTASLGWSLPTDPWTQTIGFVGSWLAKPLATLVVDPLLADGPPSPRWTAGVRVGQAIDLRKGRLLIELEAEVLELTDGTPAEPVQAVASAWLDQAGWEGTRLSGSVRYEF